MAAGFKTGGRVARDVSERFYEKVDKNGPLPGLLPELGPCWIWTARKSVGGYGQFALRRGVAVEAHRVAFFLATSIMSSRTQMLDHLCRNKACVRLSHLELVTNQVNVIRGRSADLREPKAVCNAGHALTPENRRASYTHSGSRRVVLGGCKTCHREKAQLMKKKTVL